MGTAEIADPDPARPYMAVKHVRPGMAVTGGSLDQVATLVTMIPVTVAQRAERRTSGATHGILLTGDSRNAVRQIAHLKNKCTVIS